MIPLYFLGFLYASTADAPRRFIRAMTMVWSLAFGITLVPYLGGPGSLLDFSGPALARFSYLLEWRPFGTSAVPGGEAIFAFMALPFAFYLIRRGDYNLRDPWIRGLLVPRRNGEPTGSRHVRRRGKGSSPGRPSVVAP